MASINEILGRNIDSVKELKKAITELQGSLIGLDTESQEYKDTTAKLTAAQEELTKVTQAGKVSNDAAKDSIVGMQQEYKKLYDTYKMLTEEQRNSDFGKEMAKSLSTLSESINERKKEVGNFKDNIGRYAGDISKAFSDMGVSVGALQGPLKLATTGTKGLNEVFKLIAKNPWMAALTAILGVLLKVASYIQKNEELTNRLKDAMSAFKPVLDWIANAFDWLAKGLVSAIEGMAKFGEKILSIIPGYKEAAKSHKELAKATTDLTKAQREANVENSKKTAEIERLREEASATDDLMEKKQKLQEAQEIQRQIDEQNIALAQEELRILQEYSEKTANSAEENEKLAAAQQKVNQAIAQGEANMRAYNKQITQVENKTKSAASAGKNWREEAKKLYEQTIEENKTEIVKLTEKYEKEKKLLEKYHYDTKLLTKKYNEELAAIIKTDNDKQVEKAKRVAELNYKQLANYYQYIQNMGDAWYDALGKAQFKDDALDNVREFFDRIVEVVDSGGNEVQRMFRTIFENVDFADLKNLDKVKEVIYNVGDEKTIAENVVTWKKYGEKMYLAVVDGFQEKAAELNAVFGMDLKNMFDVASQAGKSGQEAADAWFNVFYVEVDKLQKENKGKVSDFLYEEINELGAMSPDFNQLYQKTILESEYNMLETMKSMYEKEIDSLDLSLEEKTQLYEEYFGIVNEMYERQAALSELNQQRTLEMVQSLGDATDSLGSVMGTMKSSYESLIDSELKAGKIDEKTANDRKKRLEKLEIAEQSFAIATIAADAASGLFSIWKGYATEVGTVNPQTAAAAGPASAAVLAGLNAKSLVSAIAKTTSLAATATAQIMAARNGIVTAQNNMSAESGGGADAGVGVTPVLIDSTPFSYTKTVQTEEDVDYLNNRPIVVRVSDILDGIETHNVQVTESTF